MKILKRIGRIALKILLLAYVFIVNSVFLIVFYMLLWSIMRIFIKDPFAWIMTTFHLPEFVVGYLPFILMALYIFYQLSPLRIWMLRLSFGLDPLKGKVKERVMRLFNELDTGLKVRFYRNDDNDINAMAFGFNTIGLNRGLLENATDEELKAVISHEIGHLKHRDYIYDSLLNAMIMFGSVSLRYIFGIITWPFRILSVIFGIFTESFAELLEAIHDWTVFIIYGGIRFCQMSLSKYSEYRCDAYSIQYGCTEGMLSFLNKIYDMEREEGEPSLREYVMSAHPKTRKRIEHLEEAINGK